MEFVATDSIFCRQIKHKGLVASAHEDRFSVP